MSLFRDHAQEPWRYRSTSDVQLSFTRTICVRQDFQRIALQVEPHNTVRRIIYYDACWAPKGRNGIRVPFSQFHPKTVECQVDISRATG